MKLTPPGICLWLIATPIAAQDKPQPFERASFRVTAVRPQGQIIIDIGKRRQLRVGDIVVVQPRVGKQQAGRVDRLEERSALVTLRDKSFRAVAGMRGEAQIPANRFAPVPKAGTEKPQPETPKTKEPPRVTPKWRNKDPDYKQGQPLLSGMRPVRPIERRSRLVGHAYLIGDFTHTETDSTDNSYLRLGTDLSLSNPFRRGGELRFDGELDYLTETSGERGADLLVRDLSYTYGGNRFEVERLQAGRFLQHGMPEFGILDGVEWSNRSADRRHRYGAAIGFMPEPDDDHNSLADLQVSGYYLWSASDEERLTAGLGVQKTLHNGKFDRDLLVGKARYLAEDGLDLSAVAWIDFYDGRSNHKPFVELTRLQLSVGRSYGDGSGYDLSFLHNRFPELFRNAFYPPVYAAELDQNQLNQLSFRAWTWTEAGSRLHGALLGFVDEGASGGAGEIGIDMPNFLFEKGRTDITLFANTGQFSSVIGARTRLERSDDTGRWDIFYEISHHHLFGFPDDGDDLIHHRLRGGRTFFLGDAWECNAYAEGHLFDDTFNWSFGFFCQRRF